MSSSRTPWLWVPTLYLVEGLPYAIVNTIALAVFKDMGVDNGTLGPLTTLISLPWLIKPLWSPFMDIFRSKRWWILLTQILMTVTVIATALCLPFCGMTMLIILFIIVAFASATHDISADGYYMLALDRQRQSSFVGIRNTFYRGGLVLGQGLLVMLAGLLQQRTGNVPRAWALVIGISAVLMALIALYHFFFLPHPDEDRDQRDAKTAKQIFSEFGASFKTFFSKPAVGWAIAFMLLYRLPEALSLNLLYPFFKDGADVGGLGAGTSMYGLVYGTFGVIALLLGGILGGLYAAKRGLRASYWPMALALALPCAVYLLMAILRPESVWVIGGFVVLDQFGYGFGFTAYTMYLIYVAQGEHKTAHYAIGTAFMALGMMLPGMAAGWISDHVGYTMFFVWACICTIPGIIAALLVRKQIPADFGTKTE